jgi:hypothetical protein
MAFEHFNTEPPKPAEDSQVTTPTTEVKSEVQPNTQVTPTESPKVEPKPDEFIENFNKRYNTTYKSDDEVKPLFELPKKITEYEEKVKDRDELVKSVEQYKKDLEELRAFGNSDLLKDPLIQKAFVASQLKNKYPNRDEFLLQEIAMSDLDKMSDIEAIAKEKMIDIKGLTFERAKLAKLADFGVDSTVNPEEWGEVEKARIQIAGAEAKQRMKQILEGITLPKQVTKEEKEAMATKALEDKVRTTAPIRETFKKFDEYVNGDFKFVVPDEYKATLDGVFQGMFIDSGLEVNETNLKNAEFFKRAMFVEEYFPKMVEIIKKEAQTALKEQIEKELHNEKPLNTTTATDQEVKPEKKGLDNLFQDKSDKRVTKF